MSYLTIVLVVLAAIIDTFAAYISRVYGEFGKILSHEVQDNLDEWEQKVEPLIGLSREHAALAASLFHREELRIKDLKRYLKRKGVPVRG